MYVGWCHSGGCDWSEAYRSQEAMLSAGNYHMRREPGVEHSVQILSDRTIDLLMTAIEKVQEDEKALIEAKSVDGELDEGTVYPTTREE